MTCCRASNGLSAMRDRHVRFYTKVCSLYGQILSKTGFCLTLRHFKEGSELRVLMDCH